MILDFFRNLCRKRNKTENKTDEFIEELSEYLDEEKEVKKMGIIEKLKSETGVSNISEVKMLQKQNDIIKEYANGDNIYFISKRDDEKNNYIVFNFENDKKHTIRLTQEELPDNVEINCILRKENDKYILDEEGTKHVQDEIEKMTKEVLQEQNDELEKYRQEGHLYIVKEDINDSIYLFDITSNPEFSIEEVDFPKELRSEATEGTVFKYENGQYSFYERK